MKKLLYIMVFALILLIGAILRLFNNINNPPSLNIDEVAIGYNAYSILKTGKDEYGTRLPLSFRSVGDYKPPVLIYLTIPSIAVFGLNEFAVRFPTALLSILTIPLFYYFLWRLTKDRLMSLLGVGFLTISPWHIYYSRYAVEATAALFFLLLGFVCLLKVKGQFYWGILAGIFLSISMYAYHSERLFVPIFLIACFIFFLIRKRLDKRYIIFAASLLLVSVPLIVSTIFGPDKIRAQTTFITNDINFTRYVDVGQANFLNNKQVLLFFYWIRKFLSYFQPSFWFYDGLYMTTKGIYGLGVIYLFELPLVLIGIYSLIKKWSTLSLLIFSWILLGIIPASLTQNEQHSLRTLVILPAVLFIGALGAKEYVLFWKNTKNKFLSLIINSIYSLLIFWNLGLALLIFSVHFPIQKGENFMEGTKQVVEYALNHKDEYKEIVFDPVRGIQGPYIVSVPHTYVLFYSRYDPYKYQTELKRTGMELYGFDKYTFRHINWPEDRSKYGTLFIGSAWSLPQKDIKPDEILKKVYLSNGQLAFLIVSPKVD